MSRDREELDPMRRRLALAIGAGAGLVGLAGCAASPASRTTPSLGRVVVVGGGYGGASAARYLKFWGGPGLDVTLVEREARFVSCPLSNLVLGGSRTLESLTLGYDGLRAAGVNVVHDEVASLDAGRRRVTLKSGAVLDGDRIVLSPGIDVDSAAVQGLAADTQGRILHAWKAGAQTLALRRQLEAMPDGGVYVLTVPTAPYRCPPGPYERACQVAHYFKTRKPRSKVVILDANPEIVSKKALFTKVFNETYKGIIEYRPQSNVTEVDARTLTAVTELGDRIRADVLNVVPPQKAALLAQQAGLVNVNGRWCRVDWMTLESSAAPGIHVLGDATFAAPAMPKSGHMANQHGKVAAAAIVETLSGRSPLPPMMTNTCYSFTDDRQVIHVASVHRWVPEKKTLEIVPGSGGVSVEPNLLEGVHANAWAANLWKDMLG